MSTIIGICGGSGSGKTTFVNALKESLKGQKVSFISFDNYYKKREDQKIDEEGVQNFDLPESMLIEQFLVDLDSLKKGNTVERIEYVFNNELKEPSKLVLEPNEVLIIEGLFIYHYPKLLEQFDLKLFINADDEIKIIRRIQRDKVERNYPLDDVLYRYQNHVIPSYRRYIEPHISEMDLIINNNKSFHKAIEVLTGYISTIA